MTDQPDFTDIIGLTVKEAEAKVADRGINCIRVRWEDGTALMGTMDMRTDRLNVSTQDGKIASIGRIG